MRAIISVSDKTSIVEFAKGLVDLGFEILSSGGSYRLLKENFIYATEVSDFTGAKEMFDGRVKTLHPKIHGGILYKRDDKNHLKTAEEFGIKSIDLVCVNLYPFIETTKKTKDLETIIENIDIGGPAMIRSAAKNYKDIIVVTDIKDYNLVLQAIKEKKCDLEFRKHMMIKAFELTAYYDSHIANYMNEIFKSSFGNRKFIVANKAFDTRYGENPHQRGAAYEFDDFLSKNFFSLKGEASFNNMTDIHAAVSLASSFSNAPCVAICKHANPCGLAIKDNLLNSYEEALKCDPVSSFGGVVAINGTLSKELALKTKETFIEVIIAANVEDGVLEIYKDKKRTKIFTQNSQFLKTAGDKWDFKRIDGGFVFGDRDFIRDDEVLNAKLVTNKAASNNEINDLLIAYKISALTKSNCIVYVKNATLLAIGMGMTSRVDAARAAVAKAADIGISLEGASMASEAFFPFRDSIDLASAVGVGSIIQPGGSMRDPEVIEAANSHNMSMYFSGVRHFLH